MTSVNDFGMVPMVQSLPFGGCKDSGFGVFNGREGLRGFSRMKSLVTDRFPIRMAAPSFLLYPVADNAHLIVQEGLKMIYGRSYFESAKALFKFLWLITKAKKPK